MTIKEANQFYSTDKKEYDIKNNIEFIDWLNELVKNGYSQYLSFDDMEDLINNLVMWYEIKYPNRLLDKSSSDIRFDGIKSIADYMTIKQLLYRLPPKQLRIIDANYRARSSCSEYVYNKKGKTIGYKNEIGIFFERKNYTDEMFFNGEPKRLLVHIDSETGKITSSLDLEDYIEKMEDLTIEKLYIILKEVLGNDYDLKELEKCIYNNNCDKELREKLLHLVSLKLLYSKNTIPEFGYKRAKLFIKEFNKKLNLNLSTDQIDEIINSNCDDEVVLKKTK